MLLCPNIRIEFGSGDSVRHFGVLAFDFGVLDVGAGNLDSCCGNVRCTRVSELHFLVLAIGFEVWDVGDTLVSWPGS